MPNLSDLMSARDATALRELLRRIDAREVAVTTTKAPEWCGYPEYEVEGWKFQVFDDCGEWDYFEWVETPLGVRIDPFEAGDHAHPDEEEFRTWNRPEGCLACVAETYRPEHDEDWGYAVAR